VEDHWGHGSVRVHNDRYTQNTFRDDSPAGKLWELQLRDLREKTGAHLVIALLITKGDSPQTGDKWET